MMKTLAKKKKEDSVAIQPQNNRGSCGHDLSSDWELEQARKWKKESSTGYDKMDIIGKEMAEELEQGIHMTRTECASLQKAWEQFQQGSIQRT